MDTIEFPVESVKEINRSMYSLYKFFSETVSKIDNPDFRKRTPQQEFDYHSRPWLSYVFQFKDMKLSIHKFRTGYYSLEALGFIITKIMPTHKYSQYRYNNYYGRYDSLDDAVSAFNTVVKNFVTNENGELF